MGINYKQFIEDNFTIIDLNGVEVPFKLNIIQTQYLLHDTKSRKDLILKARRMGFSSVILALFTAGFLMKENSYNALGLLEKVKGYIESYESVNKKKYLYFILIYFLLFPIMYLKPIGLYYFYLCCIIYTY